ncbi:hypothetical protein KSS87_015193, partial [Heliosperma pusillum]
MTQYDLPNGPNFNRYNTRFSVFSGPRVSNDCKSQKHFIFSDKVSTQILSIKEGDLRVSLCDKRF